MAVRAVCVVAVARAAASAWQRVACNPETLPADHVLALLCCAPLHLLAGLASFLCLPSLLFFSPPRRHRRLLLLPPYAPSSSSSSTSSSSSNEDDDEEDMEGLEIRPHTD